ncbi:mannose-1-phosphate guanylyltransferase/mannose-6-phosphate isomerase [Microvirga massiliensis]|uniref:mannose-1-phosphate guanylyltransferase/mannose-6-phosphate isomerase n=1 Tax=Microvirga massiliensis TaxID=1033741 RepID=UPI00062B2E67|nr:mannose-1-phosphate guanylyltransferase/mannose-6-phosphate isomerase [Microvirga massiliensis]
MTDSVERIFPVLLSGGNGSRLWPLSRESYPKQFLRLMGRESLLQQAALRVKDPDLFEPLTVIGSEEHRFIIAEQTRVVDVATTPLILEPVGRNTAPAAAIAALGVAQVDPEALLLLMPADHLVQDSEAFRADVRRGMAAARAGKIVLFGVKPTAPATGFGYVRVDAAGGEEDGASRVAAFVEKPDLTRAEAYVASGQHYWNSGMFLASARTLLQAFEALAPDILSACRAALREIRSDLDFLRLDRDHFSRCPSISLDYAVIEKTERAALIPVSFDWADLGTWSAIWDIEAKDDKANVTCGETHVRASTGCYVRSEGPVVAALGVENLIIVATPDAVLVASKDHDQDVKQIVADLAAKGHSVATQNPRVHRPWGFYQPVHDGDRFQVKRITVNPGAKLSLQKHYHRAEHWVVVNGTAIVRRDNEELLLRENESIFIPLGAVHRLENPGKVPLNLIEVQSGPYLGEDDIVRLEDIYARH